LTPLRMDTLLLYRMTSSAQRCFFCEVSFQTGGTYTGLHEVVAVSEMDRQPWKWENFEKMFQQKLPLKERGQSMLDNMKWVEDYIQNILKKAMPKVDAMSSNVVEASQIEVFETHEHVIVQVKLHKDEDPRALQVFVKSNQVKITGWLKEGSKIIKLPTLVSPQTANARYKSRTLQIQIRKRGSKEGYREAFIRF
jgi:HSP20 family molecular chaperone IbpA